jgi:hypothetical protein
MKRLTLAILLGWLLLGPVAPASAAAGDVPPRPLTGQGLTNLTALTRLLGYVRFFHPSDPVAALTNSDWDALAMAGIERVEAARDPRELAAALADLFAGIAPTVRVLPFAASDQSAVQPAHGAGDAGDGGAVRFLAWRHQGVDLHTPFTGGGPHPHDRRPASAALADLLSLTSGATPQWRRFRALNELASGLPGGTATLTVKPHAGGPVRTVTVAYTAPVGSSYGVGGFGSPVEPRPEKIAEVRPGIFYVDLSRITDDDLRARSASLPRPTVSSSTCGATPSASRRTC